MHTKLPNTIKRPLPPKTVRRRSLFTAENVLLGVAGMVVLAGAIMMLTAVARPAPSPNKAGPIARPVSDPNAGPKPIATATPTPAPKVENAPPVSPPTGPADKPTPAPNAEKKPAVATTSPSVVGVEDPVGAQLEDDDFVTIARLEPSPTSVPTLSFLALDLAPEKERVVPRASEDGETYFLKEKSDENKVVARFFTTQDHKEVRFHREGKGFERNDAHFWWLRKCLLEVSSGGQTRLFRLYRQIRLPMELTLLPRGGFMEGSIALCDAGRVKAGGEAGKGSADPGGVAENAVVLDQAQSRALRLMWKDPTLLLAGGNVRLADGTTLPFLCEPEKDIKLGYVVPDLAKHLAVLRQLYVATSFKGFAYRVEVRYASQKSLERPSDDDAISKDETDPRHRINVNLSNLLTALRTLREGATRRAALAAQSASADFKNTLVSKGRDDKPDEASREKSDGRPPDPPAVTGKTAASAYKNYGEFLRKLSETNLAQYETEQLKKIRGVSFVVRRLVKRSRDNGATVKVQDDVIVVGTPQAN